MQWPKKIVVWPDDEQKLPHRYAASSILPGPTNSLPDERIYVLAPQPKRSKPARARNKKGSKR